MCSLQGDNLASQNDDDDADDDDDDDDDDDQQWFWVTTSEKGRWYSANIATAMSNS